MERIVAVSHGGHSIATPFSVLEEERVVAFSVGDLEAVTFFQLGTASALDSFWIPGSRDVGATNVFLHVVGDRTLTFQATDSGFTDIETGSAWNLLGRAVSGPLARAQLEQVVHANHFWFAWAAFKSDTAIYTGHP